MNAPMDAARLGMDANAAFLEACALDVAALKPGNVSRESPGHGMTAADFLTSARAAAPFVTDPTLPPGERIFHAVAATRDRVGCNTNLGILLLAVPLVHAAQHRAPGETHQASLARTLDGFDLAQTGRVYQAIRLAAPGGLGASPRHDVREQPTAPLLTAMREARRRDSIARQYANGFADILLDGRQSLARARTRWRDESAAVSALFMVYLSTFPDSHIQRKHGSGEAERVRQMARIGLQDMNRHPDWPGGRAVLAELDGTLKTAGINPGTSADLTVATWLADRLAEDADTSPPDT